MILNSASEDGVKALLDEKQDKLTGTEGQVVGFDAEGNPVAQEAPEGGVTSFNGRTGAITPQSGDYTAAQVGAVSTSDVIGLENGGTGQTTAAEALWSLINGSQLFMSSVCSTDDYVGIGDVSGKAGRKISIASLKQVMNVPSGVGVTTFNGRTGAVSPTNGDYTAEQVGALPVSGGTMSGTIGYEPDSSINAPTITCKDTEKRQILFDYSNDHTTLWFAKNFTSNQARSVTVSGVADPTSDYDAANKKYVDAAVSASTGGVTSFNGRTGAVVPKSGDYTAAMVGAAPAIMTRGNDYIFTSQTGQIIFRNGLSEHLILFLKQNFGAYISFIGFNGNANSTNSMPVEGIADPEGDWFAANKHYVDNAISARALVAEQKLEEQQNVLDAIVVSSLMEGDDV